jgi:hypothetical protein
VANLPAEPVTPAKLRNIADWLMNGCNRGQAAVELRILAQDLERAHETNGDGHDLHCRATARRTDIGCDCGGFDRRRFEAAPCYLCGYSGEGYYQVSFHPCAALYHERTAPETPREHPPELMTVVDKWQDYANALREGRLPSYSTHHRTIDALLSEVRGALPKTGGDAKDAARYRWLREKAGEDAGERYDDFVSGLSSYCYGPDEFDMKIDNAIAGSAVKASCRHPIDATMTTGTRGIWKCRACGALLHDDPSDTRG